ncbi:MAG: hypothetical protein IJW36_00435 [Clostridia bacterium]|nr:hypothetical protein [Clostridia bacterium]
MSKTNLIVKLFNRIVGKKTKCSSSKTLTQQENYDVEEFNEAVKRNETPLEFQDRINNELWLNGQGG